MKGLLIKDLRLSCSNKVFFIAIFFIGLTFMSGGGAEQASMVVGYISMMFGFGVLNTMAYDEMDGSGIFLLTMPIDRKIYVLEKYIYGILSIVTGGVLSAVVCGIILHCFNKTFLFSTLCVVAVIALMLFLMIPIQFKFGNANGRIATLIFAGVAIASLIVFNGALVGTVAGDQISAWGGAILQLVVDIYRINEWLLVLLGLIVVLIGLGISAAVSLHVINKKEY